MISDLQEGKFSDVFLVQSCKVLKTKKDKRPYTVLTFKDKSGTISAFIWDTELRYIQPGMFVKASGNATHHKNELVLRLNSTGITPVKQPESLDKYIYSLDSLTINNLWQELLSIISRVQKPSIKQMLDELLENHSEFGDFNLKNAPLTLERYGAYAGALLEHIVYCLRHTQAIQQNYYDRNIPIDPDLITTLCVLHDIGKLKAYQNILQPEKTAAGRMLPISTLSLEVLSDILEGCNTLTDTELLKIKEGIVSCHSEVGPKTIEALIVSNVESLDAKIGIYSRALNFARHDEEFVTLQVESGELFNG